jgi:8-oxo-dGTP pyrophosphatase MutT (NUDIX family)
MPLVQVNGTEGDSLTAFISKRNFANFALSLDMESQIYKIYFNEEALIITDSIDALKGIPNLYFIGDEELHKSFKILISSESYGKAMTFGLICPDPKATFEDFTEEYIVIQAAGGLVFNKNSELLTIKRNGVWDLPKGKIEKHEDQRAAALREVMEETGINHINISDKIGKTYHTYYEDKATLLKEIHWYKMNSQGNPGLTPQTEEGITEVKFAGLEWFDSEEFKTYPSIRDIINQAKSMSELEIQ